jgi:hypothetical protein
MTNQHRATPEQWEYQERWASDDDDASCILELRCRVEALEAAQLEQAESNRFCTDAIVRRVEVLEATQHAHADLSRLSDAEREQVTQELAKPAAWRPLDIETTCGTEAAFATAQQILRAPIVVEGTFEHGGETYRFKAKPERESAMTELRASSAEVRPTVKDSLTDGGSLVERVAEGIAAADDEGLTNMTWNHHASAAIREVAAALAEANDYSAHGQRDLRCGWVAAVSWLAQEADRG